MNVYYYEIYGLKVASELALPEAFGIPGTDAPDIRITLGDVPKRFEAEKEADKDCSRTESPTSGWFWSKGAGEYYMENGNHICVKPEGNPVLTRSMLLGGAMCYVNMQRGRAVLHAGTFTTPGGAVLISGASGAGKSTVMSEVLRYPVGFMADDTTAVDEGAGGWYACATYPRQKLCRDRVEAKRESLEDLIYIDEDRDKFSVSQRSRYVNSPVKIRAMFILRVHTEADREEVEVTEVTGTNKIVRLLENLYLDNIYRLVTGYPPELKVKILKLASSIRIYEVRRPQTGQYGEEIAGRILTIAGDTNKAPAGAHGY